MMCDPTLPKCPLGCQPLVTDLFVSCKAVCLPDGYFYDPLWYYKGCWNDNFEDVVVGVERCGCNSAFTLRNAGSLVVLAAASIAVLFLQGLILQCHLNPTSFPFLWAVYINCRYLFVGIHFNFNPTIFSFQYVCDALLETYYRVGFIIILI